jgi:hypothetical protein
MALPNVPNFLAEFKAKKKCKKGLKNQDPAIIQERKDIDIWLFWTKILEFPPGYNKGKSNNVTVLEQIIKK